MARKVSPQEVRSIESQAIPVRDGDEDMSIIAPDITLTIQGRSITLREPTFFDGMAIRRQAAPLTEALNDGIKGGKVLTEDIIDILAEHRELVVDLVARSGNVEAEWVKNLPGPAGEELLNAWWGACGPFFIRQIARRIGQALYLAATSDGATSSPSSSPQDTTSPR